jgi:hypothetical protein
LRLLLLGWGCCLVWLVWWCSVGGGVVLLAADGYCMPSSSLMSQQFV